MRPLSSQRPHLVASSSTASAAPHRRSLPRTAATPARPPPPPPRRTGRRPPTTQLLTEELARDLPGPDDEPLDELVEAETIAVRRGEGNSATPSLAHTCSPDPKTLSFPRPFFFFKAELGTTSSRRIVLPRHGVSVTLASLHKEYATPRGPVTGVRHTDLAIRPNALTALVGPSGSGKTTLLRLLSGLEAPSSGRILFDGLDVTALPPKARRVGVVFQGYALFKHMTVAENIAFGPRMLNLPGDHGARVAELLDLVELPHIAGRLPSQLSGGQKQRVALARALAAEPRLLLLDEPFSALDPEVRRALRSGLRDILDRAGVTAIMVSHDQEEAFAMADEVVIFNRGGVCQTGTPSSIRASPASPFVMDFVTEANKLPADCIFTRRMGVNAGGKPYVMCAPGVVAAHRWPPGGPRPAHADMPGFGSTSISPSPPSPPASSSPPLLHIGATVIDKSFGGAVRKYILEFDDGVRCAAHVPTSAGDDGDLEVAARAFVRCEPGAFMPFDVDDLLT